MQLGREGLQQSTLARDTRAALALRDDSTMGMRALFPLGAVSLPPALLKRHCASATTGKQRGAIVSGSRKTFFVDLEEGMWQQATAPLFLLLLPSSHG